MKRHSLAFAIVFALTLLAPLPAIHGQEDSATLGSKESPAEEFEGKKVTISGTVSLDGKIFIADQGNQSWQIINPKKVSGLKGQHVTITVVENSPRDRFLVKKVH